MKTFREEVRKFAHAMEYKLAKNEHKGGWEGMSVRDLLEKLSEEVDELENAVNDGNDMDIQLEAADVANYAMMLSHNARLRNANSRLDAGSKRQTMDDSNYQQGRIASGTQLSGHNPGKRNWEQGGPDPAITGSRDPGCNVARPGRDSDGGHSDSSED